MLDHVKAAGRREDGFTLPELLIVLFITGVVLAGVANLMQTTLRQSSGVITRTDATQRGRLVMDRMTQQLRSQICVDTGLTDAGNNLIEKPSLAYAAPNRVVFYADLGNGAAKPDGTSRVERRELVYDTANKRILQRRFIATSQLGAAPTTFSGTVSETVLLSNVSTPPEGMFRFYAYDDAAVPPTTTREVTGNPLSDANRAQTARIGVAMDVRPTKSGDQKIFTRLEDSVHLRTADPNYTTNPDPDCR